MAVLQAGARLFCWDTLTAALLALALFLLLLDLSGRWRRPRRYPPGPAALPLLGNALQVDFQNLPESFGQLQKKFGKVFSVQLLWKPAVVLSGPDAVREALVHRSEDTAGRPPSLVYSHLGFGPNAQGVVLAQYGEAWKEQRRFSLTTLRNLGLGKQSLERWVTAEADFLCSAFAAREGRAFDPSHLLTCSVTNVISSLTYANRFDYEDRKLQRLLELLERSLKEDVGLLREVVDSFPALLHIPGLARWFFGALKALLGILDEFLEEHKQTLDPAEPRDLTDAFLLEMEKAKGTPGSSFTPANLRMVVADLFTAGMVTTATTLRWALLLLLLHPDVQRKVQEEVDVVIGRSRRPTMKDQAHMPFTNAVIHEVQRFGDIVPLGIPHMTTRDTEIQGFFIPKGTVLITNLSSVLKDEATWEQPYRFYPEHFLDAEGRFVKPEAFMPFSAGRRVCLGEPLAKMELFLFFTCLLQDFSFVLPPGHSKPSDKAEVSFLSAPQPFQLCAVPR
ncbi:cytochrome P450 2D14 [Monodelphis domestica]|uniref:cytochrome P450 2D14 n=1 Tax=Monodelphis domestica TaxID=13616 RepID=UPI0024E1A8C0|nr:cytochrome P450 2D14 [Monodelphis domestica]